MQSYYRHPPCLQFLKQKEAVLYFFKQKTRNQTRNNKNETRILTSTSPIVLQPFKFMRQNFF
jgi:hypothetical protein